MNDRSWMYQDSLLINYTLSNLRNINGDTIRCLYKRCKKKKFIDLNVVTMHLLQKKRFMKKYICWYAHEETYVPHDTMVDVITQFWVIPQNSIFFKIKIKKIK